MSFDANFDATFDAPASAIDKTTELLICARGLVEQGWCKGAFARDRFGQLVNPMSDDAVAWCMIGALVAAGKPLNLDSAIPARTRLEAIADAPLNEFNDAQKTVEAVLEVFDKAIGSVEPTFVK